MEIPTGPYFKLYYVILIISVIAGVLHDVMAHHEVHFVWDKIPAFHAIFGFLGCFVLIFLSKTLGHYLLMRREDYYDD
ncbi:hypothetical protein DRN98_05260 [Methanosarcinales archaeon]|nr:MAG: hypothetical protein DRN98_05260 [Methanosarcinales archaeon]